VPGPAAPGAGAQKKRLTAAEQNPAARAAWWDQATWLDPADLVFVDETSTHTALTRQRARAPRGERAVGSAPRNHGPNVTLLAALTPAGIGPSVVFPGATDRLAFEAFVAQFLVPSLCPGQVVIWDNLSVHKGERARSLIEAAGCHLLFLPPYSPDCNPIEPAFAKLKSDLRRAAARTPAALEAAIGAGLNAVTPQDARAFFAHCGYPLRDHAFRKTV
jgi:transposase